MRDEQKHVRICWRHFEIYFVSNFTEVWSGNVLLPSWLGAWTSVVQQIYRHMTSLSQNVLDRQKSKPIASKAKSTKIIVVGRSWWNRIELFQFVVSLCLEATRTWKSHYCNSYYRSLRTSLLECNCKIRRLKVAWRRILPWSS